MEQSRLVERTLLVDTNRADVASLESPALLRIVREALLQWLKEEGTASSREEDRRASLMVALLMVADMVLRSQTHHTDAHLALGTEYATIERLRALFEEVKIFAPDLNRTLPKLNWNVQTADSIERLRVLLSNTKLKSAWSSEVIIGHAYQYLCQPLRKIAQSRSQTANKALPSELLIAFTQLYTPSWVVNRLVRDTLLPQWCGAASDRQTNCSVSEVSKGTHSTDPEPALPDRKPCGKRAHELTVLDPACGSGHFLLGAFDLLLSLYQQEGYELEDAIRSILSRNLYGSDIDAVGLWTTALCLYVRSRTALAAPIEGLVWSNVVNSKKETSELGSLSKRGTSFLQRKQFAAVVTNPPYIGRKLISRSLRQELKSQFSRSYHDLCAAFVDRGLEWLEDGGRLGYITQASILFLPSFSKLRQHILLNHRLVSAIELGPGVFPLQSGEKVNSVLLVVERTPPSAADCTVFGDISDKDDRESALAEIHQLAEQERRSAPEAGLWLRNAPAFLMLDRGNLAYKCPPVLLALTSKMERIQAVADVRQGLATSNNTRFLRYIWDVDPERLGSKWFPYVKGAGSERWCSPCHHVVNWQGNGAEIKAAVAESYPYLHGNISWVVKNEQYYFQEGLCFSFVNAKQLALRILPAGCIFDVAASAVFIPTNERFWLLAYLNSTFVCRLARLINPTINFQVGDVQRLPLFTYSDKTKEKLAELASQCLDLKGRVLELTAQSILDVSQYLYPQASYAGASVSAPFRWANQPGQFLRPGSSVLELLNQSDPESAYRSLCQQASSAQEELKANEDLIDRTILQCSELTSLEKHDRDEIGRWIDPQSSLNSSVASLTKGRAIVYSLTHALFNLAATPGLRHTDVRHKQGQKLRAHLAQAGDSDTRPAAGKIGGQLKALVISGKEIDGASLARAIGLSSAAQSWMTDAVGMELFFYLMQRFPLDLSKEFRGCPPLFVVPLQGMAAMLILPTMLLRCQNDRLFSREQIKLVGAEDLDAAILEEGLAIMSATAVRLAQHTDWTAAEAATALAQAISLVQQ